jgi:hypothetical protein
MRGCAALLGLIACGPSPGDADGGSAGSEASGADEASDTRGTTTPGASSADDDDDDGTTGLVSTSSAEESTDSGFMFDVGDGDESTGELPGVCAMPDRPNSDVFGTTPLGDVAMTTAVFAEDGGGKCPHSYRVVLAPDPAALAEEIERYGANDAPLDVLELQLDLPESLEPGTWTGALLQRLDGDGWHSFELTVDVTSVTSLDAPDAHVEGTVMLMDGEFMVEGPFFAPYCATVHGSACGA